MTLAVQRRLLRCSFCRKSEREVAKLLGGPKAHICDACVTVCNTVLEAVPATFAGWNGMTDDQLLDALGPTNASVEATRTILQTQVETLRQRGVTWNAIGGALGITRQAAWERFS